MPDLEKLRVYKCALSYIPNTLLDELKRSVNNLTSIEMQAYLLEKPYKCGLGMLVDALALHTADALPDVAYVGIELAQLIDYLDSNGSILEKSEVKKRLCSQINDPKSDLGGINAELLVYRTLNSENGCAELGDPNRSDVVWNHNSIIYNIECKSITNGFYRFGKSYSPFNSFNAIAIQIGSSSQYRALFNGYIGAFLLDSRELDGADPVVSWSKAILADGEGASWVETPGLAKLDSINVFTNGRSRPDIIPMTDAFNVRVFGDNRLNGIRPACNIVDSQPWDPVKWRLMFLVKEDMDSMVKRAAKEFDKAMCQHTGRSNPIVFIRLEGLHGRSIQPVGVSLPDQTELKLASADRAIAAVHAAAKESAHWPDCLALIVNVPIPSLVSKDTVLPRGRSSFFVGPAVTNPLPDTFRKQF